MTAFVTGDIPPAVNTLEELVIWNLSILNELYPSTTIVEAAGRSSRMAECAPFYIDTAQTPTWAMIGRVVLPMASTWRQGVVKPWATISEIGTLAIPAGYKS